MNEPFLRVVATISAMLCVQAAFAKDRESPTHTYARIVQIPESFDSCRAKTESPNDSEEARIIQFVIAKDGRPTKLSMYEGSPHWMTELADCAIRQLSFLPATRDETPVEQSATLGIEFRSISPEQPTDIGVKAVGPLITPPRLWRDKSTSSCFPRSKAGSMSRFVVKLTINPDGSASDLEMPLGSESWHEETARCVVDRITFTPGALDGQPVKAEVSLPIFLRTEGDSVIASSLRSTNEELESAYRACYPPDTLAMTSAFYTFDIATNGRVMNSKVAKSSGDPRLDDVGKCILDLLKFKPMMRNGQPVRSNATWELPIRPPR